MSQLVANMLDMTRLESGRASQLNREWHPLEEIVGAVLRPAAAAAAGRTR